MDTNTRFQKYLNHISPDLSYKLNGLTLLLLHPDFVAEIDLKTDKMTVFTIDRQRINELDIEVIYDLCKNIGIISSYGTSLYGTSLYGTSLYGTSLYDTEIAVR